MSRLRDDPSDEVTDPKAVVAHWLLVQRRPSVPLICLLSEYMPLSDALHVQKIGMLHAGSGKVTSPRHMAFSSLKGAFRRQQRCKWSALGLH